MQSMQGRRKSDAGPIQVHAYGQAAALENSRGACT